MEINNIEPIQQELTLQEKPKRKYTYTAYKAPKPEPSKRFQSIMDKEELALYRVVSDKAINGQIDISDIKFIENYKKVKSWFDVMGIDNKYFYVAIHNKNIVGYYFKNIQKGNALEILPDYRKNGEFGYLKVYDLLLDKVALHFPNGLYSAVSLFNVPSLSSHFKSGFKIYNINYPVGYKKIDVVYVYKNKEYKFDDNSSFSKITTLFKSHDRELSCYLIVGEERIELVRDEEDHCFVIPEIIKTYGELKYKLIYFNPKNKKFSKKKTVLNKVFSRIIKFFDYKTKEKDVISWLIENNYVDLVKITKEVDIQHNSTTVFENIYGIYKNRFNKIKRNKR